MQLIEQNETKFPYSEDPLTMFFENMKYLRHLVIEILSGVCKKSKNFSRAVVTKLQAKKVQ